MRCARWVSICTNAPNRLIRQSLRHRQKRTLNGNSQVVCFGVHLIDKRWERNGKKRIKMHRRAHAQTRPTCMGVWILPCPICGTHAPLPNTWLFIATSMKIKSEYIDTRFSSFFSLEYIFKIGTRKEDRPRPWLSQASKYVQFSKGYQRWNSLKIHIECERSEKKRRENAWRTISLRWAAERLVALDRATPWETDLRRADTVFSF